MDRDPLPLRARLSAPSAGTGVRGGERIGLAGVLGERRGPRRRMRAAAAPGTAVARAWRWDPRDRWSSRWWPQGVALGEVDGAPVALVSWFAQRGRGTRVSVVGLRDADRPRYRHVELVVLGPDGVLEPVVIHAGGIAWMPGTDRLYAAATFGGLREFRLGDIARRDRRLVLPQHAEFAASGRRSERLRHSFISAVVSGAAGAGELVAGEYRTDPDGRIARLRVDGDRAEIVEVLVPGIPSMQGAVLREGVWAISASRGDREPGDLWTGPRDAFVRHPAALPPGPEDLAHDAAGRLWGVSEFPGRRWLYELGVAPLP